MKFPESSEWSYGKIVALLAWLDFCKEAGVDFRDTAEEHMEKSTGEVINKSKIHGKLRHIWIGKSKREFSRRESGISLAEEIRQKGTSCLVDLSTKTRDDIRTKLEEYRMKSSQMDSVGDKRQTILGEMTPVQSSLKTPEITSQTSTTPAAVARTLGQNRQTLVVSLNHWIIWRGC